jgi:hypothetical protein
MTSFLPDYSKPVSKRSDANNVNWQRFQQSKDVLNAAILYFMRLRFQSDIERRDFFILLALCDSQFIPSVGHSSR